MPGELILECKNICKSFGPTRALVNVDLRVHRGDVLGLIGENGSGKSTLTSIIAGAQKPDSGEMYIGGKKYAPASMVDGQKRGVAMIVQEMGTLPGTTVAANVFVGNTGTFKKGLLVDNAKMKVEAAGILKKIGAGDIKPDSFVDVLNFEDRKIVEIARAMYLSPEILIIDESTTALAQKGRTIIYQIIKKMQEADKAVIFISHDMDELMSVCNVITVLRDGAKIDTLDREHMSITAMRKLMIGRELNDNYFRSDYDGSYDEKEVLRGVRLSSGDGMIMNLDIVLHKGEILGIGGLANCGMHELGKMLFGASKPVTGYSKNMITDTVLSNPEISVKNRVGYVAKDRDIESMIISASIKDNIIIPSLGKMAKKNRGFISQKEELAIAEEQIEKLKIKCTGANQGCSELSGGNKQKVVFGKWLACDCDILIIDCPTRGIDIGVKAAMYAIMYELKKAGKAILMISEEMQELIGMSDRILIMKDGKVTAELARSESVTESMIVEYMI